MFVNESLHSLIIAQVLGIYLVIMAIIMVAKSDHYRALLNKLQADSGLIPVCASFGLMAGILLVVVHNIWLWESEVAITIIAWLIVIKSILWLSIPERMIAISKVVYSGNLYYIMAILAAIVGIFLMTHGFYLFMLV